MTRPQIIRADTIDLQGRSSPSAQDHSRQSGQVVLSEGNRAAAAPHQSQSMRNAEKEAREELTQSPRVSEDRRLHDDSEDEMNRHTTVSHHDGMDQYSNGNLSAEEGDTTDGESDDQLDDDMLDKISSSPSIDDEDIDFEFVYALHTFIATVEGQANATKGDTMVLLDDSNSYWWLVRVVKDGSIGYLPAEHIETPTERLARLNKHRNIDLSATMLGDNAEKSKNPLKKAMRRRNAKTVTFTSSPIYHEPSDIEYSTEEEEEEEGDDQFFDDDDDNADSNDGHEGSQKEDVVDESLRTNSQTDKDVANGQEQERAREPSPTKARASGDSFDRQEDMTSGRSRNGVVRNTDSFFKDDSVETMKISLTPNLLRDDSNSVSAANDTKEMKGRGSLEAFDKAIGLGDKSKDDKKRKEKKGMLSGLFKRKDKKGKATDDDVEESEKISEESTRSSTPPKMSSESLKEERPASKSQNAPQRNPSKLHKPPPETSPAKSESGQPSTPHGPSNVANSKAPPIKDGSATLVRAVPSEAQDNPVPQPLRVKSPDAAREKSTTPGEQLRPDSVSPMKTTFLNTSISSLDGSQKSVDSTAVSNKESIRSTAIAAGEDEISESPVNISSPEFRNRNNPPGLTADTSSVDDPFNPPISPTLSSPELVEHPDTKLEDNSAPTSSTNTPTWSEASLRSYLEDDADIKDLLIIVHDKSNVTPAGPDHPITGSLFKEESKTLNEMSIRLDELLTSWMSRKMQASVSK
ncbi:hypothetical protein PAAG_02963 [Paracoccidioides lutzii Pb01]|uniref:SH3 domain-containing protein n=1 Tax=Paracoccidioides lutzii (strain ATCC MYA-826 / Pb01) TaxID=502779 RepID=C1GWR8_PARBA|nr:hypothetical protein PAAG_02963 [Paracoccidioides lutzii Pb01]EEH40987.2 hypothetical protein PAAG_02963 [Paracoccidioides lutzii Pb01]